MNERRIAKRIERMFNRLSPDMRRFLLAHLSRPVENRPPFPG